MKLRYSHGKGSAPRHVSDFQQHGKKGWLVVRDESGSEARLEFAHHAELQSHIEELIAQRVPFSIGGMCPGPAEVLHHWFVKRDITPDYLEISWQGPDDWIVREIVEGATEWQKVSIGPLLSNN